MPGALLHLAWGCCAGLCRPGSPLARLVVMAGYKKFKMPGVIIHLARSTGGHHSLLALFVVVAIAWVCGFTTGEPGPFVAGVLGLLLACCGGHCSCIVGVVRCCGHCTGVWVHRWRAGPVCHGCAGFVAGVLGWVHCCRGRDHSLLALFIAVAIAQVCWVHR